MSVTPLYPFGHGLSYTTFEYANLRIDPPHAETGSVRIRLDVRGNQIYATGVELRTA